MLCAISTAISSSYAPSPMLNHIVARGKVVWGVTVLFDQVFLVRHHAAEVEVYDIATLTLQRHLVISGLLVSIDMTSSANYNCLYVADVGRHDGKTRFIHRVELNGTTTKWPLKDRPRGLSVTPDGSNVIVTCREIRKLKEYTTHGDLVREIRLQEDMTNPWHAVPLTSGQFVVSHGGSSDPLHRMCLVEVNGRLTKCFGGQPGSAAAQTCIPQHLVVDRDGSILVADVNNDRVILLTASLDYVRELVPRRDVIKRWRPVRLCLDAEHGVLYVAEAEWDGKAYIAGQLAAYHVKTFYKSDFSQILHETHRTVLAV